MILKFIFVALLSVSFVSELSIALSVLYYSFM
jgi:hypothetical protein